MAGSKQFEGAGELFDAVGRAEQAASARFAPGAVIEALRRVLS